MPLETWYFPNWLPFIEWANRRLLFGNYLGHIPPFSRKRSIAWEFLLHTLWIILSNGVVYGLSAHISWPAIRCLALYISTSYRVLAIHTYIITIAIVVRKQWCRLYLTFENLFIFELFKFGCGRGTLVHNFRKKCRICTVQIWLTGRGRNEAQDWSFWWNNYIEHATFKQFKRLKTS